MHNQTIFRVHPTLHDSTTSQTSTARHFKLRLSSDYDGTARKCSVLAAAHILHVLQMIDNTAKHESIARQSSMLIENTAHHDCSPQMIVQPDNL